MFKASSNPFRSTKRTPQPPRPDRRPPPSQPHSSQPSPSPRPSPASAPPAEPQDPRFNSLQQLDLLRQKLDSLLSSFSPPPPSTLTFTPTSTSLSPKLAFTSENAPVHAYEEALTKLLVELDGVDSLGEEEIRKRRKGMVKEVEGELERVEREVRRGAWEVQHAGGREGVASEENGGKAPLPPPLPHPVPTPSSSSSTPLTTPSQPSSSSSTAHCPLPGHFSSSHPSSSSSSSAKLNPSAPSFPSSSSSSARGPQYASQPLRGERTPPQYPSREQSPRRAVNNNGNGFSPSRQQQRQERGYGRPVDAGWGGRGEGGRGAERDGYSSAGGRGFGNGGGSAGGAWGQPRREEQGGRWGFI
ncbi:hypothetical protein JCM8547_004104 [Rhodosporidiobolus lusitaniae]